MLASYYYVLYAGEGEDSCLLDTALSAEEAVYKSHEGLHGLWFRYPVDKAGDLSEGEQWQSL